MPDGSLHVNALRSFELSAATDRQFRDCLGRFATGVTVVTTRTASGFIGMTANSFSSVSMSPPLVLWCPAKGSSRYTHFAQAQHFAIHVLGAEQQDLAMAFARSGDAFDGLDVAVNAQGTPILQDCLARIECTTHGLHDAGDHSIMVGRVVSAALREGAPLIFSQGTFTQFDKGP